MSCRSQEPELSKTASSQSVQPTSPKSPRLLHQSEMSNQSSRPAPEAIKSPRLLQLSETSSKQSSVPPGEIRSPRLLQLSETSSKQSSVQPAEPVSSPRLLDPSLSTGSGSSLRDVMGHALSEYASLTKSERHNSRRYSEVDMAMVRGISLRSSLRGLGRLWRYNPTSWKPQERAALYDLSSPARSFKVFVSHTWQTPGRWKILGLSLQCGWRSALGFWFMAVFVSCVLCAADILPMPFSYEPTMTIFPETYTMGFWVLPSGMVATLLGLVSAPYWPERCSGSDTSFIDVASIHQAQETAWSTVRVVSWNLILMLLFPIPSSLPCRGGSEAHGEGNLWNCGFSEDFPRASNSFFRAILFQARLSPKEIARHKGTVEGFRACGVSCTRPSGYQALVRL